MANQHSLTAIAYDKRGRILAVGVNSYTKSHTLQAKLAKKAGNPDRIYLHAEIACLTKVQDHSKVHTLAVFRYDSRGRPKNARPCEICQHAIDLFGVPNVKYTVG